ncbi:MAG: hypothetical protein ACP6KW_05205 [Candidatus Thorarchaeota archaeon]
MSLREDSSYYCLIWLGLLVLGAYYFNFAYLLMTQPLYVPVVIANLWNILFLLLLPLGMVFFFTGYLRPSRGKAKRAALGPSLVSAMFFVILAYILSMSTDMLGDVIYFSSWGIGGSLLTAGGFSILQSLDQATTRGIMDVSALHYGPPPAEPEPEPEPAPVETAAGETEPDEPSAPSEPSTSE